jgi:hypothetical protein
LAVDLGVEPATGANRGLDRGLNPVGARRQQRHGEERAGAPAITKAWLPCSSSGRSPIGVIESVCFQRYSTIEPGSTAGMTKETAFSLARPARIRPLINRLSIELEHTLVGLMVRPATSKMAPGVR